MTNSSKYYVYVHLRATTEEPFYYGKGCGRRAWDLDRNTWHRNVLNKHGVIVKIISYGLTNEEAKSEEVRLIAEARQRGENITNQTRGGDGIDPSTARKIGLRHKENGTGVFDPKFRGKGGRVGGRKTQELKVGIFSPENIGKGGKIGGVVSRDLGVGMFAEGVRSNAGKIGGLKGGKINGPAAGKRVSSLVRKCLVCGLVRDAGNLGKHQKLTGHQGWEDVTSEAND